MKQTRNTVAKAEVLRLLQASKCALSHAEIQHELHGLCDRVTIYRVLDRLLEEELVHKVVNADGGVKYASCNKCSTGAEHKHNHLHFSCEICSQVTCLDMIEPMFKLPRKYKVKEVHFTVSGVCPNCS